MANLMAESLAPGDVIVQDDIGLRALYEQSQDLLL